MFLFLAALYESWSVPFSVLLAVPIGAFGAILTLVFVPSLTNNVYAQIGLITLIGLAAKNAILIVEFAKVRVDRGEDLIQSTLEAVSLRLRPIVMTSLAFILGVLPLVFATGAGAVARRTIRFHRVGRHAGSLHHRYLCRPGALRADHPGFLWKEAPGISEGTPRRPYGEGEKSGSTEHRPRARVRNSKITRPARNGSKNRSKPTRPRMIANTFIKRPVTAIVISIVLIVSGVISVFNLAVDQYPDISPPSVSVSGQYTGADAQTVEQTVAIPIEEQVNGSPGMEYMQSTNTNNGAMNVRVTFGIGTNVHIAALNVQNRVGIATPLLPAAVAQAGH